MKKVIPLIFTLLLVGCCDDQVIPMPPPILQNKFPAADPELLKECPNLAAVPPTDKLSVVTGVVVDNYTEYSLCQSKLDDWVTWYVKQKAIYESVNSVQ